MRRLEEFFEEKLPEALAMLEASNLEEGKFGRWLASGVEHPKKFGLRKAEKLMRRFEIKKSYQIECVEKKALIMRGDEVESTFYWLAVLLLVQRGMTDEDLRFWNTALKILDLRLVTPDATRLRVLMEEQFTNISMA